MTNRGFWRSVLNSIIRKWAIKTPGCSETQSTAWNPKIRSSLQALVTSSCD
jgi:hypothetical protein